METRAEQRLLDIYANISSQIKELGVKTKEAPLYFNDNNNSWIYILFVAVIFAGSFTALMCNYFKKYIWKSDFIKTNIILLLGEAAQVS